MKGWAAVVEILVSAEVLRFQEPKQSGKANGTQCGVLKSVAWERALENILTDVGVAPRLSFLCAHLALPLAAVQDRSAPFGG